jgi:single-strand DNA-binding protein
MSGSVNKVLIIGNLTKDPEMRQTQNSKQIANLTVATSEKWKDKNSGEQKEKSEFHRVVVFSEGAAKFCGDYLKKGSKVYVEGQLQTRKWTDNNGVDKYATEIVVQGFNGTITSLDKPQKNESTEPASYAAASSGSSEFVSEDLDDGAIPF